MIKLKKAAIIALGLTLLSSFTFAEENFEVKNVSFSGGEKTVKYVEIDLEENYMVDLVLAKDKINQQENMIDIIQRERTENPDTEIVAAVNGAFFSAYDGNPTPWGTLQKYGEVLHIGSNGSTFGIDTRNNLHFDNVEVKITGNTNGQSWYSWGINHTYDSDYAVGVFTPAFGESTYEHQRKSIAVSNGTVTEIAVGKAAIPEDGFVIITDVADILNRFRVGYEVDMNFIFDRFSFSSDQSTFNWTNMFTSVGAGPMLVKDGVNIADGLKEGFFEEKINIVKANRSFIGEDNDGSLIMGTMPSVTVKEAAEVLINLGVKNAMNLDGGASSGLYFGDGIKTAPGRELNNVLVVKKLGEEAIKFKRKIVSEIEGIYNDLEPHYAVTDNFSTLEKAGILTSSEDGYFGADENMKKEGVMKALLRIVDYENDYSGKVDGLVVYKRANELRLVPRSMSAFALTTKNSDMALMVKILNNKYPGLDISDSSFTLEPNEKATKSQIALVLYEVYAYYNKIETI